MSDTLTTEGYDNAIPLHRVSCDGVEEWLETLSPSQARWAKDNDFTAKQNEILRLPDAQGGMAAVAIGLGTEENDPWHMAALARNLPAGNYRLLGDTDPKHTAIVWALAQYRFDRYLKKKKTKKAVLVLQGEADLAEATILINGIKLVRDLVNTPTCHMGPSHLSATMKDIADRFEADFSETVGDDLLAKGYNSIHTVGRAAANQPRLLELNWGRADAPRVTLVGKGVCFDTGGLDLKPSAGMRIMKKDMGGAAHTLALTQAIMASGLDIRLRLLIPAVENNISADAFRPGDIIKTYKGTTVEVDNTDAEGRLVLCDALALAAEDDPALILDFATLTGAARVAMGPSIVPFFTDGDDLAQGLSDCGVAERDPVWRMPLYAPYAPGLKSDCADLNNMGSGPYGGAIMAALFLKHFVKEPEKWVHFDVFAWNLTSQPGRPKGGEAMAFRAVHAYLKNRFGTSS